ncbi:hypothetical protein [Novipirellula herctigrandis]|uniref:hypothetical protein n=1 Tax=Novipirellula herctigrandis TaxID=2527986 RepID=UPI003AF39113
MSQSNLDPVTVETLENFSRRRRWLILVRCVAVAVLAFAIAILVVALCDYLWILSDPVRWGLSAVAYGITASVLWYFGLRYLGQTDPKRLAIQLEAVAPRVRDDLLSAVEFADPEAVNGSPELQDRLQRMVARRLLLLDVSKLLPMELVRRWLWLGSGIVVCYLLLMLVPSLQFGRRIARAALPIAAIERASQTQVTILEPSPESKFVAEGDAVAVVVGIGGRIPHDVTLQWQVDGRTLETPMLSRQLGLGSSPQPEASEQNQTNDTELQCSANIGVGSTNVRYRVLAGDAVTLWHTLSPLPRPRVTSFDKRYEYPAYASVEDTVETSEHGDIRALVGTMAHLTVHFDQPVRDATLRYGNQGVAVPLEPTDSTATSYTVSVPVKTAGHYQMDAVSQRSGLDNPFSPQYTITPVIDTPPVIRWDDSVRSTTLASPLDVLSLAGSVSDDLPINRIHQEFSINSGLFEEYSLSIDQPEKEISLEWSWDFEWSWDLMHREEGTSKTESVDESPKMQHGDAIQIRLVAIDRRGQRSTSNLIQVLIVDETFSQDRYDQLESLAEIVQQVIAWTEKATIVTEQLKTALPTSDSKTSLGEAKTKLTDLQKRTRGLIGNIESRLPECEHEPDATNLELLGRVAIDLQAELDVAVFMIELYGSGDWQESEKDIKRIGDQLNHIKNENRSVADSARAMLAQKVSIGALTDIASLYQSMERFADEDSGVPTGRYPRYIKLAEARMQAVDDLMDEYSDLLPEFTNKRFRDWRGYSQSWQIRLRNAMSDPSGNEDVRSLVRQYVRELEGKRNGSILDGNLSNRLRDGIGQLNRRIESSRESTTQISRAGSRAASSRKELGKTDDADKAAEASRETKHQEAIYEFKLVQLTDRLQRHESLHRQRPNVDLRYAADLNLFRRALIHVNQGGFVDIGEERPEQVHDKLGQAIGVIESVHSMGTVVAELNELLLAESQRASYANARIEHPHWSDRIVQGIQHSIEAIKQNGVDWSFLHPIQDVLYGESLRLATGRIGERRWQGEPPLSADLWLRPVVGELQPAFAGLTPEVDKARETIQQYVPSLAEQARRAAEKVAQAKEQTETREDASKETAEQLAEKHREAEQAAAETMRSLADHANNANLMDAEQQELARDADAASAQIGDALSRAQQDMQQATAASNQEKRSESLDKTATSLEKLEKALEQTADHFERAEAGEDVSQSREALREAAEELQNEQLMREFEAAKAMADAASASPEEMLRRLEAELKRNQPMQKELSEIGDDSAESAEQLLRDAAEKQTNIQKDFEKSDRALRETKAQKQQQLSSLSRRLETVRNAILNRAREVAKTARVPGMTDKFSETQQTLQKTAQAIRSETEGEHLMAELNESATKSAEAVEKVREAVKEIGDQASDATQDAITDNQTERDRAERNAKQQQTESRNQHSRETQQQIQWWTQRYNEAKRRISDAQREIREGEKRVRQAEEELAKQSDNQWRKDVVANAKEQLQNEKIAEEAARQSGQFAKDRKADAEQRKRDIESQRIDDLKDPNPSAQAATRMAKQAMDELEAIQSELEQLAEETNETQPQSISSQSAQSASHRQIAVTDQTQSVADVLERVARHEQRLGNNKTNQTLNQAAESVEQNAVSAARSAEANLEAVKESSDAAPNANQAMAEATKKIDAEASKLAEMLSRLSDDAQDGSSSENQAQQDRARQLAQTLDELDRAVFQKSNQRSSSGQGQQSEQGQSGSQGEPSSENGQGKQPSASEASPTLASEMNQRNQGLAKQRQSQIQSASDASKPSDSTSPRQSSATRTTNRRSSSTSIAAGGPLNSVDMNRLGSEWGKLRERRTDDAIETDATVASPEYQSQIEAYFQAVARRASESRASESRASESRASESRASESRASE